MARDPAKPGVVDAQTEPADIRTSGRKALALKIAAFMGIMIAVVVVPFLLFGSELDSLSRELMASPASKPIVALAGMALLAADVVLPVPSTVVISVMGALLGAPLATLAAALGLSIGCLAGYWLGRRLGHDLAERNIGESDFKFLTRWLDRYGVVALALCRPVPVLAEASVIAAGVMGLAPTRVLLVTTLANVGFAGVYASLGAAADTGAGMAAALAASLALPLVAMLLAKVAKTAGT